MIGSSRANRLDKVCRQASLMAALLATLAGCSRIDAPAGVTPSRTTLRMAFGLSSGQDPQAGTGQVGTIIAAETLVGFGRDGRAQARLAESWSLSADGLLLRVQLRSNATFHDGQAVTASAVRALLTRQLPNFLGPAFADIEEIRTPTPFTLEFALKRRSALVLEGMSDIPIQGSELPNRVPNGTGPFKVERMTSENVEMVANDSYYGGRPFVDTIQIKPYASVRAAWADLLREQVDMLYEVGTDAVDLLQPSKNVKIVINQRNYAYILLLNVRRPSLRDPEFRRSLNAAIDREALISEILKGHGSPAVGAVWPHHWAYDLDGPEFRYDPRFQGTAQHRFTCVFADASQERLALAVQKQLHAAGVDMDLELLPPDQTLARVRKGDFDAFLSDFQLGPTLLQPYRFWRSGSLRNWGQLSNSKVDAALDLIGISSNEEEYRKGVGAFQRAIYDDPPAIFLAWSERARAVSTRFDVPIEPGRDILGTLRLWRPAVTGQQLATRN